MAKIILTHEVTGLGQPGDVVEVKSGYARNFLLPRNLATPWTKGGEKQIELIRKARKSREIASEEAAKSLKQSLEAAKVVVTERAGSEGRLFGAVTVSEIATAIQAASGNNVDKRKIEIKSPIKTTGEHVVSVNLLGDIAASITVKVVAA